MQATRLAWSQETSSYRATKHPDHEVRLKAVDRLVSLMQLGIQHTGAAAASSSGTLTREEWERQLREYAGLPPADKPN